MAKSQNIDTVYVRNTVMQAGDWGYLTGKLLSKEQDSLTIVALRRMRTTALAVNPQNFTTNVTIDSIPGSVMLDLYKMLLFAPYLETRTRGEAIFDAIRAKTQLTGFINEIDVAVGNLFIRQRAKGKNYLQDTTQ